MNDSVMNEINANTFEAIFKVIFNRVMRRLALSPVFEKRGFHSLSEMCGGDSYHHITSVIKNAMMRKWLSDFYNEVVNGEIEHLNTHSFAREIFSEVEKSLR